MGRSPDPGLLERRRHVRHLDGRRIARAGPGNLGRVLAWILKEGDGVCRSFTATIQDFFRSLPMIDNRVLSDTRIAILAMDGFEQQELEVPLKYLGACGAEVEVVSMEAETIRGWHDGEWGRNVDVDRTLDRAPHDRYAALVIPGGRMSPDLLREHPAAIDYVRTFAAMHKPTAAICHGPWVLADAQLLRGREVTSYPSIRNDLVNAGGRWVDRNVVVDDDIITSRNPGDLDVFCEAIVTRLLGKVTRAAE
jgi:protease I